MSTEQRGGVIIPVDFIRGARTDKPQPRRTKDRILAREVPHEPFHILGIPDKNGRNTELVDVSKIQKVDRAIIGRVDDLFTLLSKDVKTGVDYNEGEELAVEYLRLAPTEGTCPQVSSLMINRVPYDSPISETSKRPRLELVVNHLLLSRQDQTIVSVNYQPDSSYTGLVTMVGRESLGLTPLIVTSQIEAAVYNKRYLEVLCDEKVDRKIHNEFDRDLNLNERWRLRNLLDDVILL